MTVCDIAEFMSVRLKKIFGDCNILVMFKDTFAKTSPVGYLM